MVEVVLKSGPREDEHIAMIASTFVCTLVALLVLSVRTYTRLKVVRNFGWDVSRAAQLSRSYDLFSLYQTLMN